jgi:hypothetical protein
MAQQPLAPEHPSGENRPSQVPSDWSQTSPGTDTVGVPRYGWLKLRVLHLLPGALATLAYLALVPLASRVHFPTNVRFAAFCGYRARSARNGAPLAPGKTA